MSVTGEMWVRGHRERIDTALWQFEESLAGSVKTGDRCLGNPDFEGHAASWYNSANDEAAVEPGRSPRDGRRRDTLD